MTMAFTRSCTWFVTLVGVTAVTTGCGGDDGSTGYPIMPTGGGGGMATRPDAAPGSDASEMLTGRVCLVSDARALTSCAASGADGFTVTLGTAQATTAADGTFSLLPPTGTGLRWQVTGTGIESSAMAYSATVTSPSIPAVSTVLYGDMLAATQATVVTGDGAIIAGVTRNGTAVAAVTATAVPAPDSEVYYDGVTAVDWELDATDAAGVVWIPSIATGTASVTFDDGAAQSTASGITVVDSTITFVFHTLP